MTGGLHVGDPVITPDGPGRIVSFWQVFEGWHRRTDVVVELDEHNQLYRKIYRPQELEQIAEVEA